MYGNVTEDLHQMTQEEVAMKKALFLNLKPLSPLVHLVLNSPWTIHENKISIKI